MQSVVTVASRSSGMVSRSTRAKARNAAIGLVEAVVGKQREASGSPNCFRALSGKQE